MTISHGVVLAAAGLIGGALNTAGAGGGVIIFLTLLATGQPAHVAVATSQTAIPASFAGAIVPTWRNRHTYRPLLPAIPAALTGTVVGVWVVAHLSAAAFRAAAPWLTAVAAVLLIVQPHLPRLHARRGAPIPSGSAGPVDAEPGDHAHRPVGLPLACYAVAVYAGAFGGGAAVAVLLVFLILTNWGWHEANGAKNAVCLLMSLVGAAAFLTTGLAHLPSVLVLVAGQLAGGALGVWVADRLSADTLRRTVAVVAAAGAVAMAAGT